jgi:hypothetical protein
MSVDRERERQKKVRMKGQSEQFLYEFYTDYTAYRNTKCVLTVSIIESTQRCYYIYWATLLIQTVATVVRVACFYCGAVIVCDCSPHCHYISAHCYQYVR